MHKCIVECRNFYFIGIFIKKVKLANKLVLRFSVAGPNVCVSMAAWPKIWPKI